MALQKMLQEAASGPMARDIRQSAVTPFLREQGEFLAGSGRQLGDFLGEHVPGVGEYFAKNPISDTSVGLGLGGLSQAALASLLQSSPPEGRY